MLRYGEFGLKPLFKVTVDRHAKEIEGDFVAVKKSKRHVEFDRGLYMATLAKGKAEAFELCPTDGPLMAKVSRSLTETHLTQGYIVGYDGILDDITCAFFLTRHKPSPTFGKASFRGENKVISISGFFLSMPNPRSGEHTSIIVPHLHIVFQNEESGKIFSGHLVDALSGRLRLEAVPLTGKMLRRETDPNTGGMYLRTDKQEELHPTRGDSILFALGPEEDFPNEPLKRLLEKGIAKAKFSFAVGTLELAHLESSAGEEIVKPKEGLELAYTSGHIVFGGEKYSHMTSVHLTDRYGNQYEGLLQSSKVKDLVEGILEIIE